MTNNLKLLLGKHCKIASSIPCGTIKQFDKNTLKSRKITQESPIHALLCQKLDSIDGLDYVIELEDAIPGRNFRLDIVFPEKMIGIEVDGWQNHGKTKAGFQKDREKQNLYTEAGWVILRYTAADIYKNIDAVSAQIKRVLKM